MKINLFSTMAFLLILTVTVNAQWQSTLVKISSEGDLSYMKDGEGYIIPDFSHAGYKVGKSTPEVDLPNRTVTVYMVEFKNSVLQLRKLISTH